MKFGTFNRVFKIGNIVIKLSRDKQELISLLKLSSLKKIKKYEKSINLMDNIETGKIYLTFRFFNIICIIQNYIEGLTIEEFLLSDGVKLEDKIMIINKFLRLYFANCQSHVIIDWNMKNFIINKENLILIDLYPILYREDLKQITDSRLKPYIEVLLDFKEQCIAIITYILIYLINYDIDKVIEIYALISNNVMEKLKFNIDKYITENKSLYCSKLKLIIDYLNGLITKENLLDNVKKYSMKRKILGGKDNV